MTEPLYRSLRVLEYVGERDALQAHLERRVLKGVSPPGWDAGKVRIFEAILGEYPQPVTDQVKVKLMQMVVDADENEIGTPEYREGYANACCEVLEFIGYKVEKENLHG